jgi:hypothetical protein
VRLSRSSSTHTRSSPRRRRSASFDHAQRVHPDEPLPAHGPHSAVLVTEAIAKDVAACEQIVAKASQGQMREPTQNPRLHTRTCLAKSDTTAEVSLMRRRSITLLLKRERRRRFRAHP